MGSGFSTALSGGTCACGSGNNPLGWGVDSLPHAAEPTAFYYVTIPLGGEWILYTLEAELEAERCLVTIPLGGEWILYRASASYWLTYISNNPLGWGVDSLLLAELHERELEIVTIPLGGEWILYARRARACVFRRAR